MTAMRRRTQTRLLLLSLSCGLVLLLGPTLAAVGQTLATTSSSDTIDVTKLDPGDAQPDWDAATSTTNLTSVGGASPSGTTTTSFFGGGTLGDPFQVHRYTIEMEEEAEELPLPDYEYVDVAGSVKDPASECPGGIDTLVTATVSGDDCLLRPQMTFTDGYFDTSSTVVTPNATKYNHQTGFLIFGYVGDIIEATVKNIQPEAVDGTALSTGFYAPADNIQTVHWHGMELDNESDGTPVSEYGTAPGMQRMYRYRLYRPGTYWFHPHILPLLIESRGMEGRIVIRDHDEDILALHNVLPVQYHAFQLDDSTVANDFNKTLLRGTTIFQVFSDFEVDNHLMPDLRPDLNGDGKCDRGVQAGDCVTREGELVFVNGVVPTSDANIPTVYIPEGRGSRIAFIDGSFERFYRFRLLLDGEEPPFGPAERVNRADTGQCYAPGSTVKFSGSDPLSCDQGLPLYRIGGQNGLLDYVRLEGQAELPPADPFVPRDYDTIIRTGEDFLGPSMRTEFVVVPKDRDGHYLKAGQEMFIWTIDFPHGATATFFDNNIGNGASNNRDFAPRKLVRIKVTPRIPFVPNFDIHEGTALRANSLVHHPVENLRNLPTVQLSAVPGGLDPVGNPFQGSEDENVMLGNHVKDGTRFPSINNIKGVYGGDPPSQNGDNLPTQGASRYARTGDVIEFAYANDTGNGHHPLHHHGFSFQPISIHNFTTTDVDGDGIDEIHLDPTPVYTYDYNEFLDVISMQPGKAVVYRMKMNDRFKIPDAVSFTTAQLRQDFPYDESATYGGPGDIPNPNAQFGGALGRWVFHCHILHHARLGMITDLCIAPAGDPDASGCKIDVDENITEPIGN